MRGDKLRKLCNVCGFVIIFSLFMVPCSYGQAKDPEKPSELLKKADMLHSEGYYSQAAGVAEDILSFNQETLGRTSADIAESLDHLGELYYLAGKYKESEPLLQQALSVKKEIYGTDHLNAAKTHGHLGILYNFTGEHEQAQSHLDKAYQISEKAYGKNHPAVAEILVNMARLRINQGSRDQRNRC